METRIERFGPADFDALTDLWEASVRATHTFLLQGEVERLRPMVRDACLDSVDIYGMRGHDGRPVAFAGVCGDKLEMLFVHPSFFGRGLGRTLVSHVVNTLGVRFVDVNEQKYRCYGFLPGVWVLRKYRAMKRTARVCLTRCCTWSLYGGNGSYL